MREIIYICLISSGLISCTSNEIKKLSGKDTSEIILAALNHREFLKNELTPARADTLYILKEKDYNKSWPTKTPYFKIIYVEDTKETKLINKGVGYSCDGGKRITFSFLSLNKDTVSALLYNCGTTTSYECKFTFKDNKWKTWSCYI